MRDIFEPWVEESTSAGPGHCEKCGRFVPNASLGGGDGPGIDGEYSEVTGTCSAHGRQIIVWERT